MTSPIRRQYTLSVPRSSLRAPSAQVSSDANLPAFDIMMNMLRQWGLESLAPVVRQMLEDGREPDHVAVLLQDTQEYKRRFAGNELRRQKGLSVLSPADYLATEAAYRQIMESSGLPSGFYDSPSDFSEWIGNDVSPVEIQNRVATAVDMAEAMLDQDTAAAFRDFFGLDSLGLAAAYALDRDRGQREVERAFRTGLVGGAARAQGLDVSQVRAEQLAASGIVGEESYRQAMAEVARMSENVGRLSGIHGDSFGAEYGQFEAEQDVFFADEESRRRRNRLRQAEEAEFSGGSGASPQSLAQAPGQI